MWGTHRAPRHGRASWPFDTREVFIHGLKCAFPSVERSAYLSRVTGQGAVVLLPATRNGFA